MPGVIPRLAVIVAVLLAALGVWAFLEIADEVLEGERQRLDERLLLVLRDPGDPATPLGPPWLRRTALSFTALGDIANLVLLVAAVAVFLGLTRRWRPLLLVLLAGVGAGLLSLVLKTQFQRARPTVVLGLHETTTLSFPSGHALASAAVYLSLAVIVAHVVRPWRLRVYVLGAACLLTLLVGLTRVYLGVHYPTDVAAGWSLGLAWAMLCWLGVMLIRRTRPGPDLPPGSRAE